VAAVEVIAAKAAVMVVIKIKISNTRQYAKNFDSIRIKSHDHLCIRTVYYTDLHLRSTATACTELLCQCVWNCQIKKHSVNCCERKLQVSHVLSLPIMKRNRGFKEADNDF